MAKRFTDSEKWQDVWFTELSNDNKIIWLYLLDTCDNAGIFKLNLKLLNFNCSTNITVEEFISIFKKKITQINEESWLINKYCYYQYGPDFLTSKNKAVEKAVVKLIQLGVIKNIKGTNTLSIGYQYPIDTLQEEEEVKEEVKEEIKEEVKEKIKVEEKIEVKTKDELREVIKNMKFKDEDLKKKLLFHLAGGYMTQENKEYINKYKTQLIEKIPALNEYI